MTQVKGAQQKRAEVASKQRGRARTLAQRRADLEAQMRAHHDETMALLAADDLPGVKRRLKALRKDLGRKQGERVTQQQLAERIDVPYRTYQSWENAEVETEGENYGKLASFYTETLARPVSKNWILYGSEEPPALPSPAAEEADPDDLSDRLERVEAAVAATQMELRALRSGQTELLAELSQVRASQEAQRRKPEPGEHGQEGTGS